jgi:dTDP-4-amino-4,6-dideoxygalactose transaminase
MAVSQSGIALPAIAGGDPVFPGGLALIRPPVGDPDAVARDIRDILASGMLTNGARVRELEERAADYLDVRHCVAVSSCTAGLMLMLRAADVSGEVVVPSFTFAATVHAVAWNGLCPHFADIDRDTLTLSAEAAGRAVGVRTAAIMATHTYGTPADAVALAEVARRNGIRLFFDAAHAFGSRLGQRPVGGLGDAEVFSLSPTKVLVAAEGGLIATNDDMLAERCRIGRDYANPGDYDCLFVGLNARMSEVHAAIALASLDGLEERILERNAIAGRYHRALREVPGISFPRVREGDRSTFKDLTVLVEPREFGTTADELAAALEAEGIESKRYYSPPVHAMRAYRTGVAPNGDLKTTDWASERVLSLPLWSGMTDEPDRVAEAVARIQRHFAERAGAQKRYAG